MANFVEEEGKDPTRFYDQHREFRAKEIKDAIIGIQGRGYKFVKYRNCNDELVCESCRRWEEEKIPIEQALSEMKIPNLCHSELRYCRCFVLPWIDYSEEDDEPLSDFRWNTEGEEEVVEEKRSWLDRLLGRY